MKKFTLSGSDISLLKALNDTNNLKLVSENSIGLYEEVIEYDTVQTQLAPKPNMLKLLSSMMIKYEDNMKGVNFSKLHLKGKIEKGEYFPVIKGLSNYIEAAIEVYKDKLTFVDTYIKWLAFIKKHEKNLYLLSEDYYKKPYVYEGLILLTYEMSVEWIPFLVKHIKNGDSIFTQDVETHFTYMDTLCIVAQTIMDSKEFTKFIGSEKTKKMIERVEFGVEDEYANVIIEKPELFKLKGESLALYSSFIQEGYFDIIAGLFEKLTVIAYMSKNTKISLTDRIDLIRKFLEIVTHPDGRGFNAMEEIDKLDKGKISELILKRAEARILYDSDINNNPYSV